jgi:hypothetical protein
VCVCVCVCVCKRERVCVCECVWVCFRVSLRVCACGCVSVLPGSQLNHRLSGHSAVALPLPSLAHVLCALHRLLRVTARACARGPEAAAACGGALEGAARALVGATRVLLQVAEREAGGAWLDAASAVRGRVWRHGAVWCGAFLCAPRVVCRSV